MRMSVANFQYFIYIIPKPKKQQQQQKQYLKHTQKIIYLF